MGGGQPQDCRKRKQLLTPVGRVTHSDNHGTNERMVNIQPAISVVTRGNIEEIDQRMENLWKLIQILVQVCYA